MPDPRNITHTSLLEYGTANTSEHLPGLRIRPVTIAACESILSTTGSVRTRSQETMPMSSANAKGRAGGGITEYMHLKMGSAARANGTPDNEHPCLIPRVI
eukprot:5517447-Pyramimonas_sp.AAC.1